jgi:hypothetical protein
MYIVLLLVTSNVEADVVTVTGMMKVKDLRFESNRK